jgi:mono/diheme cytochrome c family protein
MDRTISKRRYLISTLVAAGAAATLPACSSPELPPEVSDPVLIAEKAPPPISGGTLIVTSNGKAVAADPDRDRIWLISLSSREVTSVALQEDDEPGRVIEDGAGRVHVALRSGGAIVTIDPATGKILNRTPVCAAPRGLAYDKSSDVVHVACNGGELVTLPAAGGEPVRNLRLDRDIRDIAVSGDKLFVSRFRSAELLAIDSQGKVLNRKQPPRFGEVGNPEFDTFSPSFSPTGAFRIVSRSNGGVMMVHQRSLTTNVIIDQPGGYGGDPRGGECSGEIVHPTITAFDQSGNPSAIPAPIIEQSVLPVDIAISADGNQMAMASAGSNKVIRTTVERLAQDSTPNVSSCASSAEALNVPGEPIAVAFWEGKLIAQTREPAAIYFLSEHEAPLLLPGATNVADTGHSLFHRAASETSSISCAACHLEGHEDGHVWKFDTIGARRTQTMGGDIFQTAPFHWDGDMAGLGAIMSEVFVNRMGGAPQGPRHINAMTNWMGKIPVLPRSLPSASETAIAHGAQVFEQAGCQACHSGEMLTNNSNVDVGTGKAFQVPSLAGIANRAPFLHDGCAATLKDRFGPCGGGDKHGKTSNLTEEELNDLVTYLETL